MILLDQNIVIYAYMPVRTEHAKVSRWLEQALNDSDTPLFLCETSVLAFLRVTTNHKIFNPPLPLSEAEEIINDLLAHQNVRLLHPGRTHFAQLTKMMREHNISGDLTMDAHLCALALWMGAKIATADKDFKKLPYVGLINPLTD